MASDLNKHEEPGDSVFPVKFEDGSDLDMYGVWVKKRPEDEETPSGSGSELKIEEFQDEKAPLKKEEAEYDTVYLDKNLPEDKADDDEKSAFMDLDDFDLNDSAFEAIDDSGDIISDDGIDPLISSENPFEISEEDMQGLPEFQNVTEGSSAIEDTEDAKDFENLDADDFLAGGETEMQDEALLNNGEDQSSDSIKLDLAFDEDYMENKESNAIDFENDGEFDDIPDELSIPESDSGETETAAAGSSAPSIDKMEYTSEFDDLINSFDEEDAPAAKDESDSHQDEQEEGLNLNVNVDEESDESAITEQNFNEDGEEDDNISIFEDMPAAEKEAPAENTFENGDDAFVIESTIIEADNIDKIKEENIKILNETQPKPHENEGEDLSALDSMLDDVMGIGTASGEPKEKADDLGGFMDGADDAAGFVSPEDAEKEPSDIGNNIYFDDIEAVKDDLFNESEPSAQTAAENNHPLQDGKATELLLQIADELSGIKTELASIKSEMADREEKLKTEIQHAAATIQKDDSTAAPQKEQSGFFGDDDMDETIALTGDELNNILITADFTEESADDNFDIPETLDTAQLAEGGASSPSTAFDADAIPETVPNAIPQDLNTLGDQIDTDGTSDITDGIFEEETPSEHPEDYIDMPDFENENFEEPNLDDFNFNLDAAANDIPESQAEPSNETEENDFISENNTEIDLSILGEEDMPADAFSDDSAAGEESLEPNTEELSGLTENADTTEAFGTETVELNPEDLSGLAETESFYIETKDESGLTDDLSALAEPETTAGLSEPEETETAETEISSTSINETPVSAEPETLGITDMGTAEDLNVPPESARAEITDAPTSAEPSAGLPKAAAVTERAADISPRTEPKAESSEQDILPVHLKNEIKSVLAYMDQLLESLPEEKIEEFAKSEYFDTYKRLFEELGIS